jgi:hypothetical protein
MCQSNISKFILLFKMWNTYTQIKGSLKKLWPMGFLNISITAFYLQVYEVYSKRDSGTRSFSFKSKEEWHQTVPKCDTALTIITFLVWRISFWGEYQYNTDVLVFVSWLWRESFAKATCADVHINMKINMLWNVTSDRF